MSCVEFGAYPACLHLLKESHRRMPASCLAGCCWSHSIYTSDCHTALEQNQHSLSALTVARGILSLPASSQSFQAYSMHPLSLFCGLRVCCGILSTWHLKGVMQSLSLVCGLRRCHDFEACLVCMWATSESHLSRMTVPLPVAWEFVVHSLCIINTTFTWKDTMQPVSLAHDINAWCCVLY